MLIGHPNIVALLYLAAGVLFIMALRGLSHPSSSRQGNLFGMVGMTIAVLTTLAQLSDGDSLFTWFLILLGIGVGGAIGAYTAKNISMTMMPELVAAFHSLVGMAAVCVAAGAVYAPEAFGILNNPAKPELGIKAASLFEMALGAAIGAITFSGSVIAFLKLSGRMSGKPIMLPARHLINGGLALLIAFLMYQFCLSGGSAWLFWLITFLSFAFGVLDHHADRRRRHARRRVDAQLLFRLGRGRHRLHTRQHRADHHGCAGRFVRRHPVVHHVQGHEPAVPVGYRRRLRWRGRGPRWRCCRAEVRSSSARPKTPPT